MYKLASRVFQAVLRRSSPILNWREPELIRGEGKLSELPKRLSRSFKRILIITDQGILKSGTLEDFKEEIEKTSLVYDFYSKVHSNPTVEMCEEIALAYNKVKADAMVAIGGGSVIDAAKGAGVLLAKPNKKLDVSSGLLRVLKDIPYLVAVPTTAGTGSEGTLAAVITDKETQTKYALMDTHLIPDVAVLDSDVTKTLPPHLIAGPGMDALTHAVEAYIGQSLTEETKAYATSAIKLIWEYLPKNYQNPDDVTARAMMLQASYEAGRAFHRSYVGNIHAMSHALSAFYDLPHGQTNATILPIVLRIYGEAVHNDLAKIADILGISDPEDDVSDKAMRFIIAVEQMNEAMEIPQYIQEIKEEDLQDLATHAENEANPLYPVPVIFNEEDFIKAYKMVRGDHNESTV